MLVRIMLLIRSQLKRIPFEALGWAWFLIEENTILLKGCVIVKQNYETKNNPNYVLLRYNIKNCEIKR